MKTSYGKILVLATAVVMLFTTLPCGAAAKGKEDLWSEDEPKLRMKWFELTDEAIERMMEEIAEENPKEAKELAKLREKNPEKFEAEVRRTMRERFGKRVREQRRLRAGRRQGRGLDMPLAPGGPAERAGVRPMRGGPVERSVVGPAEAPRGRRPGRRRMGIRENVCLDWMAKNYPEEAKRLGGLKEKKPELYQRRLLLNLRKYGRIAEAAKENPELAEILKEDLELKDRRDEVLKQIREATNDNEKKELIEELEGVIGSRFDLIVRRKQIEYERLRERLEKLKKEVDRREAEVDKRKEAKGTKVEKRVEELVGRAEKFSWD